MLNSITMTSPKPSNPTSSGSDSSDNDHRFEDILVKPPACQEQQPPPPDSSTVQALLVEQPAPNNISSDIDAAHIISGSRRSAHSANAVGYLKEDP
ncbi:hypothetical protein MJO28_008337 [Puccinia striiformis f. sp. tritici]|uniref:Uncharacterized protein n=1 Tax=Puccinia striiformis f. sp. tritici TaxID=168172 RepID=A0ACC0EA52_9BASI|nr:hypothetical protein MJO28_008337 [Puccinia striiformis f. sp. tritici]